MKKSLIYVLLLAVLFSCGNPNGPKKPENLISEDTMVDVLIELALVSSAKGTNKSVLENNGIVPKTYVYQRFNIDSLQFLNSNNYYSYHTETYAQILSRVQDSLKSMKTIIESDLESSLKKQTEKKNANKENKKNSPIK
ncbi:DUF4296 domain-containing protein [Bizionia sp. KMM 8389]